MPMHRPKASVSRTDSQIGKPASRSIATTTVQIPAMAPTLRSMPAVMITNVSPSARIAIIEPCRSRLVMLSGVMNVRVAKLSITHNTSRMPSNDIANRKL